MFQSKIKKTWTALVAFPVSFACVAGLGLAGCTAQAPNTQTAKTQAADEPSIEIDPVVGTYDLYAITAFDYTIGMDEVEKANSGAGSTSNAANANGANGAVDGADATSADSGNGGSSTGNTGSASGASASGTSASGTSASDDKMSVTLELWEDGTGRLSSEKVVNKNGTRSTETNESDLTYVHKTKSSKELEITFPSQGDEKKVSEFLYDKDIDLGEMETTYEDGVITMKNDKLFGIGLIFVKQGTVPSIKLNTLADIEAGVAEMMKSDALLDISDLDASGITGLSGSGSTVAGGDAGTLGSGSAEAAGSGSSSNGSGTVAGGTANAGSDADGASTGAGALKSEMGASSGASGSSSAQQTGSSTRINETTSSIMNQETRS